MTKNKSLKKKQQNQQNMGVKGGLVAKQKQQVGKPQGKNKKQQQNGKSNPATQGKNKKAFKAKVPQVKAEELKKNDSENDESMESSSDEGTTSETAQNKGVKMFKGLKPEEKDSDEDEDMSEDESEENEDSDEDESPTLKALIDGSLQDDDDDEDFEEGDEDDEDDEDSDIDVSELSKNGSGLAEDSDDDDDDEEDEDEGDEDDDDDDDDDDEDEDENISTDLKTLLGESLVDDEDDEDFEEGSEDDDDDDDISDSEEDEKNTSGSVDSSKSPNKTPKKEEPSPKKLSKEQQAELDAKTIYVGNIPKDTTEKAIRKLFRPFGVIENVRFRGIVSADGKMTPRVATITKKMHPKVHTIYAFVAFKDKDSAEKSLEMNGHKLGENTLRVDLSNSKNKERDQKKSVFLGNLSFAITEDEVREHFVSCGKIESVRIIRDRKSGVGRGVGYINFEEEDSVTLALEMDDTKLKNRPVRVKQYTASPKKDKKKKNKGGQKQDQKFKNGKGQNPNAHSLGKRKRSQGESKRQLNGNDSEISSPAKKAKVEKSEKSSPAKKSKVEKSQDSAPGKKLKKEKSQSPVKGNQAFQGQKAEKKKSKGNKFNKKKKVIAEKLAAGKKSAKAE